MAVLILFGAGASYGNPATYPKPPPLGKDLFQELRTQYPSAQRIPDELVRKFKSNFELGMGAFYDTRSLDVPQFLRDMGEYFSRFTPISGNYYLSLADIVSRSKHKVVFSTLNYELLLEVSLAHKGFQVVYSGDCSTMEQALVLKLHGSCNFLPASYYSGAGRYTSCQWSNWRGEELVDESKSIRVASLDECRNYYKGTDSRGPAMSIYMPGKRSLFSNDYIVTQQKMWQEELRKASKIIIIGCRVVEEDEHIWKPIANAKSPLYYVGREPDEFSNWICKTKRKYAEAISDSFEDSLLKIEALLLGKRQSRFINFNSK